MPEYVTGAGFRSAVEAHLRQRARRLLVPAYILRRQAGLERLMVRLMGVARDRWAVKGGSRTRIGSWRIGSTPFWHCRQTRRRSAETGAPS